MDNTTTVRIDNYVFELTPLTPDSQVRIKDAMEVYFQDKSNETIVQAVCWALLINCVASIKDTSSSYEFQFVGDAASDAELARLMNESAPLIGKLIGVLFERLVLDKNSFIDRYGERANGISVLPFLSICH